MGPRYCADYDAMQCAKRNGIACANCKNRIQFQGRRGAKGAWNKPCKGAKRPDPDGLGRLRCTYGGTQVAQHNIGAEPEAAEAYVCTADPTSHKPLAEAYGTGAAQHIDLHQDVLPEDTDDVDWDNMSDDEMFRLIEELFRQRANPRTLRTYRSATKAYDAWIATRVSNHDGVVRERDVIRYLFGPFRNTLNKYGKRNGPSAYQHVISALENRRLQQESQGLKPSSTPLYSVAGIRMLISSARAELRIALSTAPRKTSTMTWPQVKDTIGYARSHLRNWQALPDNPTICLGHKGVLGLVVQLALLLQLFGGRRADDVLNMSLLHTTLEEQPVGLDEPNFVGPSPATILKFAITMNKSSHATHASYARNVRPELCVHGTLAEILACMYAGPEGMEKLALDLETGSYEQIKIIPGKSGQSLNRTYLSSYTRQCLDAAGVEVAYTTPEDLDWHLNCRTGHLLKKTAGNLLNNLGSKGVATDHVKAFLSHMKDVTHLSYLETFTPACILMAGHGPDWQHHHKLGRDVLVPEALLAVLCPGLSELMEEFPGRLDLFKYLMTVLIQDVAVKMEQDDGTVSAPSASQPLSVFWQANEHLRPLLLHPQWPAFAHQVLIAQQKAHVWRLKLHLRSRHDDDEPPAELLASETKLERLQQQASAAAAAAPVMLTRRQAAKEAKQRKQMSYNPSLYTVHEVWAQFWRLERRLANGWSFRDSRSIKQQSKLRHGLVAWVLLKLGVKLPDYQHSKHGPFADLWQTWSSVALTQQLAGLKERLANTAVSNRRSGRLGALKSQLIEEVAAMKIRAAAKAARKAARKAVRIQKAARKAERQAARMAA